MREFFRIILVTCLAMLFGCAAVPDATKVKVSSSLVHGADSVKSLSAMQLELANGCLGDTASPLFWGRYFNHSDLPERGNRKQISFAREKEIPEFRGNNIRLLPVFAQNINNLTELQGRVHGVVNAADLIREVGASDLILQLASGKMIVVLNEETPLAAVLSREYYKGWIEGMMGAIDAIKANSKNIVPVIYGNITSDPALVGVLKQLHQERNIVPYGGFWRAKVDKSLQKLTNAEKCGALADWKNGSEDWDEETMGPLLIQQYNLQVNGPNKTSIDLNALNPKYSSELMKSMFYFR